MGAFRRVGNKLRPTDPQCILANAPFLNTDTGYRNQNQNPDEKRKSRSKRGCLSTLHQRLPSFFSSQVKKEDEESDEDDEDAEERQKKEAREIQDAEDAKTEPAPDQRLSTLAEEFIWALEPEVKHISPHGFNYFVVELTQPHLKIAQHFLWLEETNMTHWYLWSSLCHHANELRLSLERDNRAQWQHIYNHANHHKKKHVAMQGGLLPILKAKEQVVVGHLPESHTLLSVLFRLYKRTELYACVRVQGSNCIYDTFYPDAEIKLKKPTEGDHVATYCEISSLPWESFLPKGVSTEKEDA